MADEVVRLNCCSRYFPRKAAKPATTAISMQAARMIQVKTGLESKCLVTLGITRREKKGRSAFAYALLKALEMPCFPLAGQTHSKSGVIFCSARTSWLKCGKTRTSAKRNHPLLRLHLTDDFEILKDEYFPVTLFFPP